MAVAFRINEFRLIPFLFSETHSAWWTRGHLATIFNRSRNRLLRARITMKVVLTNLSVSGFPASSRVRARLARSHCYPRLLKIDTHAGTEKLGPSRSPLRELFTVKKTRRATQLTLLAPRSILRIECRSSMGHAVHLPFN